MPKMKIDELNQLHTESKTVDRESFAEMRSNILLLAGEHYTKKMTEWWNRSRTTSQTSENYRLRITKNWLHRAHRLYVASIMGQSPGTSVTPRNDLELQDQKAAELNQSVWEFMKNKYKLKAEMRHWCSDYCGIGEACVKVYFDPSMGELKGYEQKEDAEGNPEFDEMGEPVADEEKPVMQGEFVFERVYAHNLFRDPSAKQMTLSRWMGVEKMTSSKDLRRKYKDQPEKLKMIDEAVEEYVIFDAGRGGYSKDKDQTLLLEYYYKPCAEYPKGYFYITTKSGILEEGELPFGIWPIAWVGFDEHATKARATSIVKVARPWQAEINRASSQVAMHQVTISEDKILYQAGTKVSQGALLPGVRGMTYQGAPPTILPGRSGDQYFTYIGLQEEEMNRALLLDALDQDKTGGTEPFMLLFRSMAQSEKFQIYSEKFGEFLVSVTEIALALGKHYIDDDVLIGAIGRSEAINIAEYRSTTPLFYAIKVEEQTDTSEQKLGKQIATNHVLQYVGNQLSREDIGKMLSNMPFGNWKDSFDDFMLDSRNVKNDFLAIERGEEPRVSPRDSSDYVLKQVAKRKKERDFGFLPQPVQEMYDRYEQYHESKAAEEAQAAKDAQSEYIPVGGSMIAADMYVPASDPTKTPKRVRVPYQALEWLLKTLEAQGMSQESMEQMNSSQMAEIAGQLMGGGNAPQPQQPQPIAG